MNYKIHEFQNMNLKDKILAFKSLDQEKLDELGDFSETLIENKAPCLDKAKERIIKAKENNEKVFIAGDYDCDGIMATTIMKYLLNHLNIENGYYIPNRFTDGYGLTKEIVIKAHEKGYKLIITVDNGVKAYGALALAKELNIDVIVTDHHLIEDDLDCHCLVHPSLMDNYFHNLCGAGVAYELSRKFLNEDKLCVFAAIATIGDMMILWGANRKIVRNGIKLLNTKKFLTIQTFLKSTKINEETLSYDLIPKINSVGRLENIGNANNLVTFFLMDDNNIGKIENFKEQLINLDLKRKDLVKEMSEKALSLVDDSSNIIIVEADDFHEGLCGLAAAAITNKYHKPSLVLSKNNNEYKGSGRSIDGINLYEYLNVKNDLFIKFGGHSAAVGLTISTDSLKILKEYARNTPIAKIEKVEEVIRLTLDDLTIDNIKTLDDLRPFGKGFEIPDFYMDNVSFEKRVLLKKLYWKWTLQSLPKVEAISFDSNIDGNLSEYMVFKPTINEFMNKESVSLLVKKLG